MAENEQQFEIQKVFVKDASFESPNSPEIFREKWQPKTDVHLTAQNTKISDELYEITLNVTVTSTQNERTAFLVEIKQSGVFLIKNFPEDQLDHLIGSYCPHTLFPYAREVVSDLVTKGGFPPLLLSPVNFDALYQQQLAKIKQQQSAATDTKH
jgi:preprotein translocase subunit SecB